MPALLTCIGLLHGVAGDSVAAASHLYHRSEPVAEWARSQDMDVRIVSTLESVTDWLKASRNRHSRLSNYLLLMLAVFSLAWLALAREPRKIRVLTFAAIWLISFGYTLSMPLY